MPCLSFPKSFSIVCVFLMISVTWFPVVASNETQKIIPVDNKTQSTNFIGINSTSITTVGTGDWKKLSKYPEHIKLNSTSFLKDSQLLSEPFKNISGDAVQISSNYSNKVSVNTTSSGVHTLVKMIIYQFPGNISYLMRQRGLCQRS
jgi:hypothetical protein